MKNSMPIKSLDVSVSMLADQSTNENPGIVHQNPETVWDTLQKILPDAREQRLAYLLFHCDLKPKEIINLCGQEFPDVQEIYHLRYNILKQVLHSDLCSDRAI